MQLAVAGARPAELHLNLTAWPWLRNAEARIPVSAFARRYNSNFYAEVSNLLQTFQSALQPLSNTQITRSQWKLRNRCRQFPATAVPRQHEAFAEDIAECAIVCSNKDDLEDV